MRRLVRPLVALLAIAAVIYAARVLEVERHASVEGLRTLVDAHAPYGPLLFVGLCIATIFLHLPEIVVIAIGGIVFGAVPAFFYGWIGCVLGASGTFLLVRYGAGDAIRGAGATRFPRLRTLDERLARNGFMTVLALRIFLFAAPPLNWGLGATSVRFPHYLAGTALGVVPAIVAAVLFGDALLGGETEGERALSPGLVAGGVLLLAVLAGAAFGRRLLARGGATIAAPTMDKKF